MGARDGSTLATLAAKVEELGQMCAQLSRENAALRGQVSLLTTRNAAGNAPQDAAAAPADPTGRPAGLSAPAEPAGAGRIAPARAVSRRVLGRALGAAAAGAVGAVALADLGAQPATASNGDTITAGNVTSGENSTQVLYDGPFDYGGVVLLGNDSTYDGNSAAFPAGIGGWAGAQSTVGRGGVANGVYGYTDNGDGHGVVGVNSGLVAGSGAGVLAEAAGAAAAGVRASNSAGTAVEGTSDSTQPGATAIIGILTSKATQGQSAAVRGQNKGIHTGAYGVWGSHGGAGVGVLGDTVSGVGVAGFGETGVLGEGIANSNSRGGIFSGIAAQVRLTPSTASTHPKGGKQGDLYADKTGRLWFCKKGGSTAAWHQIA